MESWPDCFYLKQAALNSLPCGVCNSPGDAQERLNEVTFQRKVVRVGVRRGLALRVKLCTVRPAKKPDGLNLLL